MSEQITLRLIVEGEDTVTVDRAEYEAAKATGTVAELLHEQITDVETETTVVEPDGTVVLIDDYGRALPPPEPVYLVWSNRWGAWREALAGNYGGDVWTAARFTEAEACEAVDASFWPFGKPPPEVMVLAPEHDRGHFSAAEIAGIPEQMRKRVEVETRRRVVERDANAVVPERVGWDKAATS